MLNCSLINENKNEIINVKNISPLDIIDINEETHFLATAQPNTHKTHRCIHNTTDSIFISLIKEGSCYTEE